MRYLEAPRIWAPHPNGGSVEIVTRRPVVWDSQAYTQGQARVNDTMPALARTRYGAPSMWWAIAEMNPHILCPDDLIAGHMVNIPVI